jgi:hypothetical protein
MEIRWEEVAVAVAIVVGAMEYAKKLAPNVDKKVWKATMPLFSAALALTIEYLPPIVTKWLLIASGAQLGYQTVIETFKSRLAARPPDPPSSTGSK